MSKKVVLEQSKNKLVEEEKSLQSRVSEKAKLIETRKKGEKQEVTKEKKEEKKGEKERREKERREMREKEEKSLLIVKKIVSQCVE